MNRVLPILFNTEEVQATLDGRKTAKRLPVKPQPGYSSKSGYSWKGYSYGIGLTEAATLHNWTSCMIEFHTQYRPGDILYVRETWDCMPPVNFNPMLYTPSRWRPSVHMPKAAACIWLKITDVRVERLQDMESADDINYISEGAKDKHDFIRIWDSTIKKSNLGRYGWYFNPWVWVIEFERCEKPNDNPQIEDA